LLLVPKGRRRVALESCPQNGDECPCNREYPHRPGHLDEAASLEDVGVEDDDGSFDY